MFHILLMSVLLLGTPTQAQNRPRTPISGTRFAYCCNTNTGNIIPASPTGCANGQPLVPVNSQTECTTIFCRLHPERCVSPTPIPSPSPSPRVSPTPRPSPSPSPSPSPKPSATPQPSPSPTPRPSPSPSPRVSPTPKPSATPQPSPSPSPSPSASPTPTCADPNAGYDTTLSPSNNVPLYQCFRPSTAPVECLFRYAPPVQGTNWNAGCPIAVAGLNCCGWPTPSPTPSPSPFMEENGKCCRVKIGANPIFSCASLETPPPGLTLDQYDTYNRCVQHNFGSSCVWDTTNPDCCSPGIQGCGQEPGTFCKSPSVSIQYPFSSIATNPAYSVQYKYCKEQAGLSSVMENYFCCVNLEQ